MRLEGSFRFLYRRDGVYKAKRNVAAALPAAHGSTVKRVRVADRDRLFYVDLADDRAIQIVPFGPRANAFVTRSTGSIEDAFLNRDAWLGRNAPLPRPAPTPSDVQQFMDEWLAQDTTLEESLRRVVPTFDRAIAREVLVRSETSTDQVAGLDQATLLRLWKAVIEVESELSNPKPRLYEVDGETVFSLLELGELASAPVQTYATIDEAMSVFVRRTLSRTAFRNRFDPLIHMLEAEEARLARSIEQMEAQATVESRAEKYERIGHVLMAMAHEVPAGSEVVVLPDIFAEDRLIEVPLDPALSAVENAERYYRKARQSRASSTHSGRRLEELKDSRKEISHAIAELSDASNVKEVAAFEERHADLMSRVSSANQSDQSPRFKRFTVAGDFEVLVGKNAAQNEVLTFARAARHDYWLHARGVPGSHVILRMHSKTAEAPKYALEQAASIAAHFSKASGSKLVPVIVTRRKYVRKAKNGPVGSVVVDREEVLIVPPGLPKATATAN